MSASAKSYLITENKTVVPEGHAKVLADIKVEIDIDGAPYFRDFKDLDARFIKVLNHKGATFEMAYDGYSNITENVLVGLDDMPIEPFDNCTDVLVQVTKNVWGYDCDIILMGGLRKRVYFRDNLLMDSAVKRFDWFPLFKLYPDLKGKAKPPM